MMVPSNVSHITQEWLADVLKMTIQPDSFKLTSDAQDFAGFMSDMARVEFLTETGQRHNYILKLIPPEGKPTRKIVRSGSLDKTEIHTYQDLLPELIKIIPDLQQNLCRLVYATIQEENEAENIPYTSILIMEDLKSAGYFMIRFDEDFGLFEDKSYFLQGLNFLAKFHAASFGLENKANSRLLDIFEWFPRELDQDKGDHSIHLWLPQAFPAVYKILSENSNPTPKIVESFKKLEKHVIQIFYKILRAGQQFSTAVHRDLWTHNILVKENELKVIDWQTLAYGDPAFDLSVYILECLHLPYLTKENILKAAKLYYEDYEDLLKNRLGLNPKRSYLEFEKFFKTYGLGYCLIWAVLGSPDILTIPSYIPKMKRMFEVMMEFGVLEFVLKEYV